MASKGPSDVDLQIERANAALDRARNRVSTPQARHSQAQARRARRFASIAVVGIVALFAMVIGWSLLIGPVKTLGVLMLLIAAVAVFVGAGLFSREAPVTVAQIRQGSLPQIADRTGDWLVQQRRALPAPAQTLADSIGERIANLRPQLDTLDAQSVEAQELRRLVADELPDLVNRYDAVPVNLRREDRNGRVPEQELVAGMRLLDQQIDDIGRALGATRMDSLSSQKRYLELRYDEGKPPV